MDNNHHYSSNVINTSSAASYPSPSAISPHHLQNGQNQTLPPLQHHSSAMSMYASHPHTPRTPATPNTPNSMGSYAPPPPQPTARASYPMMHNPYQQPPQSYQTSSAMMPQTSVAAAHPQPIAPAPSPGGRVPPVLRPMPAGGVMPQSGLASPYAQSPMMAQPSILQENDQPTHVVGSQGRRGILPSAPGRPAAPAPGSAAAKAQIPQKDADGKFPCPHCTKTYLHAKHLKRHMLRHTGDRPYMCVLCRDTFSRSDILKRHFQKCSIRRGNPQGVSHLSHPHAHVKKAQAAAAKAAQLGHGHDGDFNGMNNVQNPGLVPFGLIPAADMNHMSSNPNDQAQLSRSSSMNRLDDGNNDDRRSVPAPVMANSNQQQYNGNVPTSMSSQMAPQLANYNMQQNQNGVPAMFNGGSNSTQQPVDWQAMFSQQRGAQHTYSTTHSSFIPNDGQTQTIKLEHHNLPSSRQDGLSASQPTQGRVVYSTWTPPADKLTYQSLSDKIIRFFYPPDVVHQSSNLNLYFSADNVEHFLESYSHFDRHFSLLHIPTFDVAKTYTGLLAAMCCIGACYSDRVSASHVRDMVTFLKAALERDPRLLSLLHDGTRCTDLEVLLSLILLHLLLTWNGTPATRQTSWAVYANIVTLARKSGLLRVSQDATLFSPLHQPDFTATAFDPSKFDWAAFIEQEKRNRVMHFIWLMDTANSLYFNSPSAFVISELQLPLPCDDAAFDARDAKSCAQALGLYGPEAARLCNPDGTQRPKQPELHMVLDALLHSSYQIQTGTTNLTGKFIIIHSILALIRRSQMEGSSALNSSMSLLSGQNDWIVNTGTSSPSSVTNSGRSSPAGGNFSPQTFKAIFTALDKFKQNWDADYVAQFAPSSHNPRRQGFSKDAIPFYYLAHYLLKNSHRGDLGLPAEQRFMQVINLVKSVKSWVKTDGASRGEVMGSVGEIDQDYGLTDLTLEFNKVFRPLPRAVESTASIKLEAGGAHLKTEAT